MKLHLNLGLTSAGASVRTLSFQLCNEHGSAVAAADYDGETLDRGMRAASLPERDYKASLALTASLTVPTAQKSLEWAYPSSDTARAFGFPLSGCWVLCLGLPGQPAHAVRSFALDQKPWAIEVARSLPFPWSPIALSLHPEFAS